MKSINENIYPHGKVKISSLLNRSLHKLKDLTSNMSLAIFFCNVNTFLLSVDLSKKLFHSSLMSVSMQNKLV
jgi:hypothetical protein